MIQNVGTTPIVGPVTLVLDTLSTSVTVVNKLGNTLTVPSGRPYLNAEIGADMVLSPQESAAVVLEFSNPNNLGINYTNRVLAGPGIP